MNRTENVELTVLCSLYDENRILLQNRAKEDWKGFTLPGGHVEEGESIVDAVIREMKEETGLTVKNPRLCGVKQFPIEGGRYLVFLFKACNYEGILTSSDEGEMKWIDRKDLDRFPLVEDFADLLRVMEDDTLTEFQYIVNDGEWAVHIR